MLQRAGRIVCSRCGANNFDTVSTCWKCSAPLAAGSHAPPPASPSVAAPSPAAPAPAASPAERLLYSATAAASVGLGGNPALANRAALWLGLLFPYFGLPIGLAFLMCDDRRRQEVGRICLLWSALSTLVHLLLLFLALIGMREYFTLIFNTIRAQYDRAGGGLGGGLGE